MALEGKSYVPTLAVRASEMNGLEFLPGATKDRMVPCFLLAPWASSNSLLRTITRIERAFPNRKYFLDFDRDYPQLDGESEPQRELRDLMAPHDCYRNWTDFVEARQNVWPCVQYVGLNEEQIREQIVRFQSMGKPYCLRIERSRFPHQLDEIVRAFASSGSSDFVIILDGGWINDPLSIASWFVGVISNALSSIDVAVPIVISCTSIPDMFTSFSSSTPTRVPFNNRQLVEQVARSTNRARVFYGDWGSTRPRHANGFASRPLDRVDYPIEAGWLIARNKEASWSFREAAGSIINSQDWSGNLGIWGEEMIQNTVINPELGIDSAQKNVAARVNIHLHRQAFLGTPPTDHRFFEEEWQD